MVHAPMLAATPGLTLDSVWARRPESAQALAERHGVRACGSAEELFERCDAVAFAVPPTVQAELGVAAAQAGCALLLEKPIAGDLAGAEALAEAVGIAGVGSLVVLSWRYAAPVRSFLGEADGFDAFGGTGWFLSGSMLGGPFRTPWRLERGPLLDLGPHVIDLLDAALGPVATVRAAGDLARFVALQLEHTTGVVSQATLSASTALDPSRSGVTLFGSSGVLEVDTGVAVGPEAFATVGRELVEVIAGRPHPLDVRRGLHLQRILDEAERQLTG
jgi:predicted dehydrogenase